MAEVLISPLRTNPYLHLSLPDFGVEELTVKVREETTRDSLETLWGFRRVLGVKSLETSTVSYSF